MALSSYHGNIRDRAGQKSKVKKVRLAVNITVTNRELPGSRDVRYRDVMIDIDLPEREFNPSGHCELLPLMGYIKEWTAEWYMLVFYKK